VKLTYLAFFVKAVALALKEVPIVNASLDEGCPARIVLHDRYHIGIAVATPGRALLVPVVRDADRARTWATIAREIERLSAEARAGKSRLDDMRGSTFHGLRRSANVGGLISTADHQPAGGRHPRRRQGGDEAAGVRRRRRDPPGRHGVPVVLLRPPGH